MDLDTVVKLAKERAKEIKVLERKLGKVEERYIQKHNELSDGAVDREVFCKFVGMVFGEDYIKPIGQVSLEELESRWTTKTEEQRKTIQSINIQASEEIQKLKSKWKKMETELRAKNKALSELKNVESDFNSANNERYELRASSELQEQELQSLRMENARLKSCQDELAKLKAGNLLGALSGNSSIEVKEKQSEKLTAANMRMKEMQREIQSLQSQKQEPVDVEAIKELTRAESTSEIEDIRSALSSAQARVKDLEEKLVATKEEYQEHRKKAQRLMMEKEMNLEKFKNRLSTEEEKNSANSEEDINSLKLRINELERTRSRESINMEYLKNITMKYMEYVEAGNYKEARTLAVVIYTVLQFSTEEVDLVKKASETHGILASIFSGTQAPGSGISHNTIHTASGRKRANL